MDGQDSRETPGSNDDRNPADLRINLNIDDKLIVSRSHTHPSDVAHCSQTSRLLNVVNETVTDEIRDYRTDY